MEQKQNTNNNENPVVDLAFYQQVLGIYLDKQLNASSELKIIYDGVIYGLTMALTIMVNPTKLPRSIDNAITALGTLVAKKESGEQLRKVGVDTLDSIAKQYAKDLGMDFESIMRKMKK